MTAPDPSKKCVECVKSLEIQHYKSQKRVSAVRLSEGGYNDMKPRCHYRPVTPEISVLSY